MSETAENADPDEAQQGSPPVGEPFTSETAREAVDGAWRSVRERELRELGLWERWKSVPPKYKREKPLEEYLPGGSEYGEPYDG